jgi:hypothetical protein
MAENKTEYVVLRSDDGETWNEYGESTAANGDSAIRVATKAENGDHHEDGHYRAVPKRSWGGPDDIVVIENETKVVSSFSKKAPAESRPRRQRRTAPAERTSDDEKQTELVGAAS